jgi:hypothetical protein
MSIKLGIRPAKRQLSKSGEMKAAHNGKNQITSFMSQPLKRLKKKKKITKAEHPRPHIAEIVSLA